MMTEFPCFPITVVVVDGCSCTCAGACFYACSMLCIEQGQIYEGTKAFRS